MAEHARLSPSAAARWMVCTPSVMLSEHVEKKSSSFADEGTLAHDVADLYLRRLLKQITEPAFLKKLKTFSSNEFYSKTLLTYAGDYAQYCLEVYTGCLAVDKATTVAVETRIDLQEYIPEGFGRGDFYCVAGDTLHFVDLKYGQGVFVEARENTQLKIYALGILNALDFMYDIENVVLHIYQPRMDNISTWEISASDLREWGENVVKTQAKKANAGEGETVAGEHCGFCPVKPRCRAYARLLDGMYEIAGNSTPKHPELLTNAEIVDVITKSKTISSWFNAVEKYAYDKALRGEVFEGLKLVASKGVRHIPDENAEQLIQKILSSFVELTRADLEVTRLKGITELEKTIGKKDFAVLCGDLAPKKEAAPKLVPASAPGEPIDPPNAAVTDFADFNPDA